ncbi:UNVERIFIED_CONTAM: hypothetical protein NCL1_27816 [Trichonephila clavipes]
MSMVTSSSSSFQRTRSSPPVPSFSHNGRKFTLEYCKSNGDINVLIGYWQSSVISSALQDLMFYIAQ